MENKKLLNFLLKDLSELDELFGEKGSVDFDELEIEFLKTRVKGAKKLVQILIERENQTKENGQEKLLEQVIEKEGVKTEIKEEIIHAEMSVEVPSVEITETEVYVSEEKAEIETIHEEPEEEIKPKKISEPEFADSKEMEMDDEEPVENSIKRLGDVFLKEKSVNDLMSADNSKLEHKLSNRPITSIHTSIGINDRFQYIRELFEGSADEFLRTVTDIDSMNNLKDAVNYLQQNFKWKKNETSLKFVNLVKRRFPND